MPPKRRKTKTPSTSSYPHLKKLFGFAIVAAIWGMIAVTALVAFYAVDMPDIHQVTQPVRRPSMTILTNDGTVLTRTGDFAGAYVTLKDVPKNLTNAIIAIEDRRFYHHFGIDVFGLMRAMFTNLRAGHAVQGGSTLTQQLAKNLFLSPDRTLKRKVQEMLLALWLEHTYTKDQILTAYLNRVYLGSGTYGVDAAAETYFGKPVGAINLRECAILAGLLRAPSRYAPTHDMSEAMARAEVVLNAMVQEKYITKDERDAALASGAIPRHKPGAGGDGRYFSDWIAEQAGALLKDTPQDLVIDTTLDLRLQRAAENHTDAILAISGDKNISQAALVTLSPDGAVRALVGGRDYYESQFNRATQAQRQPGSSFKPIIYLTAIEEGMSPNDMFVDEPITIGDWSPSNYDNKFRGNVTAREALAESINTVAVRVLQKAGIGNVIEKAHALGATSTMDHDFSLALGTNLMTPLELTGVYASIASGGRLVTPYAIKEIRNRDGQVLYRRNDVNPPIVANPQAVATLVAMMGDVIKYGTGKHAALDRPAAGKTGTSSDYRDAWFIGFTADYITGVWVGNDNNDPMIKVTGGSAPAQLWHDYMMEAEARLPPRELLEGTPSAPIITRIEKIPEETSDMIGSLIHSIFGGGKK